MRNDQKRTIARLRALAALVMAVCLLAAAFPLQAMAAASVGSTASSLTPNTQKVYVKLSRNVLFFTGDLYGNGVSVKPPVGSICQLVTDDWYTGSDGLQYYGVYYNSKRYNVLRSDVSGDLMTQAELEAYITGTLWKQGYYTTLKKSMDLVGDVRVHAVQLALYRLGYFNSVVDGTYGDLTVEAVRKFQKANGLTADGSAGALTQPVLFSMASGSSGVTGGTTTGGTTGGTTTGTVTGTTTSSPTAGTLRTIASVNLRKRATTSSARLAVVPKTVNLAYTDTSVVGGVTWFKVKYNGITGWLMGTYVNASGNSASPAIGKVLITTPGTRVRKTADGTKTGTVLAKGTTVDLIANPTTAGGYTWYNIRTSSGLVGFVRGDCATIAGSGSGTTGGSTSGGSSAIVPSSDKTFVKLPANTLLFTTEAKPATGGVTVAAGTVLQMVSTTTYTSGGVVYCSLYYNNTKYNAVYADVSGGIMSSTALSDYVKSLWNSSLNGSLKRNMNLVGDVRVYALQVALYNLGYYTGKLDGNYGSGTESAVRNFQRKSRIGVDGSCGTQTWTALRSALNTSGSTGGSTGGTTGGSTGSGSVTVTDFGTVNRVVKGTWDYGDDGAKLIPKSSYATVMDVETGKVFTVYRWSGGSHADCVPATSADTRTMCEIVGFPYNSNHPTSSQLALIKADGDSSIVNYTWPDFKNKFGGGKNIGSAWDRRAALLNVNGTVYPVSIYGFPHGFNGTDSFSGARFPDGSYFYAKNNFYGMMCIHFVDSKTHGGSSPDSKHQESINKAYNYAKSLWPSLVK